MPPAPLQPMDAPLLRKRTPLLVRGGIFHPLCRGMSQSLEMRKHKRGRESPTSKQDWSERAMSGVRPAGPISGSCGQHKVTHEVEESYR
jgi:hypothetical protein